VTVPEDQLQHAQRLHDGGLPLAEAARQAGVAVSTAYRRLQVRSTDAPVPRVQSLRPGPQLRLLARAVVQASPRVPCVTDPRLWTDPRSRADAEYAIAGCRGCPVLGACSSVAALQRPLGVVQAGRYWGQQGPSVRPPLR
jgi:hypothetical protein